MTTTQSLNNNQTSIKSIVDQVLALTTNQKQALTMFDLMSVNILLSNTYDSPSTQFCPSDLKAYLSDNFNPSIINSNMMKKVTNNQLLYGLDPNFLMNHPLLISEYTFNTSLKNNYLLCNLLELSYLRLNYIKLTALQHS